MSQAQTQQQAAGPRKVPTNGSGQSKGHGFVQFELEESATSAIENVDGTFLNEKQVSVSPFVPRHERHLSEESSKFTNVYVKNISKSMTDEELRNRFGAFGAINNAIVMRTRDGKSMGFGFVNFKRAEDARAVLGLNGRIIGLEEWCVARAQTKSEREAVLSAKLKQCEREEYPFNLFIKNFDRTVDEDKLRELFSEFGAVTSCMVSRDEKGRSLCFGFVAFSTAQAANLAITNMNWRIVGRKPLHVARAENKEERRAARLQGYRLATPEAQFTRRRTPFDVGSAKSPMYPSGTRGVGQQSISYNLKQFPPLIPSEYAAFSNQKQMLAGIRPRVGQIPKFDVPFLPKQLKQGHHPAHDRRGDGAPQQQIVPRGGYRSVYNSNASLNTSSVGESSQGVIGSRTSDVVWGQVVDNFGRYVCLELQLDQPEVLYLIESPEALMAKGSEAMDLLRFAA